MLKYIQRRSIQSHHIYNTAFTKKTKVYQNFDLHVSRNQTVTYVDFNKEASGNVLNLSMIRSLDRCFKSFDLDCEVRAVVMKGQPSVFSKGTDYLYLAHKGRDEPEAVPEYLRELYHMIYALSKNETPLLHHVTGQVFGSGIMLPYLSPFSISSSSAYLKFNEAKLGFIPTGGTSFVLSRLPGELGLYLAMTGDTMVGPDLAIHGMTARHGLPDKDFTHNFTYSVGSMSYSTSFEDHGVAFADHYRWEQYMRQYDKDNNLQELRNRTNLNKGYWQEQPENLKMVQADIRYREEMQMEKDRIFGDPTKFKGYQGQNYTNYLTKFEENCFDRYTKGPDKAFSKQRLQGAISRCFSGRTLAEIKENLRREASNGLKDWAEATLATLDSQPTHALNLIISVMRQAEQLQWHECLDLEYKVACNLATTSQFRDSAIPLLSWVKDYNRATIHENSSDFLEAMLNQEPATPLDLGAVNHELLPLKNYYEEYPQFARHYLNEHVPNVRHFRESFTEHCLYWFNEYEVDIRDNNLEIPAIRLQFWLYEEIKRRIELKAKQIKTLAQDPLTSKMYREDRMSVISDFCGEKSTRFIDKLIQERFDQAFTDRLETISKACTEAHKIEKRIFFKNLKDFLHEKRHIGKTNDAVDMLVKQTTEHKPNFDLKITNDYENSYIDYYVNQFGSKPQSEQDSRKPSSTMSDPMNPQDHLSGNMGRFVDEGEVEEEFLGQLKQMWSFAKELMKRVDIRKYGPLEFDKIQPADLPKDPKNAEKDQARRKKEEENQKLREIYLALQEEFYVKTGEADPYKAMELLKQPDFKLDLAGIPARRLEVLRQFLKFDSKIPYPNRIRRKFQLEFTEHFIKPDIKDIDKDMLVRLEKRSPQAVISMIDLFTDPETERSVKPFNRQYDNLLQNYKGTLETQLEEQNDREGENLISFPHRALLDKAYLKVVYGEKSYIPQLLDFKTEDLEEIDEMTDYINLRESPQEWLENKIRAYVTDLFDERFKDERNLARDELIAYDLALQAKLQPDNLKRFLVQELDVHASALFSPRFHDIDMDRLDAEEYALVSRLDTHKGKFEKDMENFKIFEIDNTHKEYIDAKYKNKKQPYKPKEDYYDDEMIDWAKIKIEDQARTPEEYEELWKPQPAQTFRERYQDHMNFKGHLRKQYGESMNRARVLESLEKIAELGRAPKSVDEDTLSSIRSEKEKLAS